MLSNLKLNMKRITKRIIHLRIDSSEGGIQMVQVEEGKKNRVRRIRHIHIDIIIRIDRIRVSCIVTAHCTIQMPWLCATCRAAKPP